MTVKLAWITGVMALACCMTTLGQEEDEDFLLPNDTVLAAEEDPLSLFADPDHTCGTSIAFGELDQPLHASSVELDRAYELDDVGRIKTEWPLPADATPLAINGNRLLVHQAEAGEEFVFVTPDDDTGITLIDPPEASSLEDDGYQNSVNCPAPSDEWDVCSRFVDGATGALRTIAYRFQCTW